MNTPAHLSIGLAAALGVCVAVGASPEFAAGAGVASLVGSRAPDWDIKVERWRRKLAARRFIGRPFRGFGVRHRGGSHWLVSACLFTLVCGLGAFLAWPAATLPVLTGVGSGYFGHLAGDGCTIRGVPYWGPWSKRPVNLLGRRASKWMSSGPWCGRVARWVGKLMGQRTPKWVLSTGGQAVGVVASLAALGLAVVLSGAMSYT